MRNSWLWIMLLAWPFIGGTISGVKAQQVRSVQGTAAEDQLSGLPWRMHVVDDELRGADGAKLADVNGDGLTDIVTGWEESGRTRAYLHPGVTKVHESWPYVDLGTTPSVEDAVWVDLDSDGRLDVLSCCEGKEQTLFAHMAPPLDAAWLDSGSWTQKAIKSSQGVTRWMYAEPLSIQDHSNDRRDVPRRNRVDVVVASKNPQGQISILTVVDGDVEAATIAPLVEAAWIMSVEVLDVDGDGDEDILYSDRKGTQSGVYWLENTDADLPADRQAKWDRHAIGGLGREVMFLSLGRASSGTAEIANQSRDAFDSIYVPAKPNTVFVFGRDAVSTSNRVRWTSKQIVVEPVSALGFAKSVAAADLDRDGELEVAFACESAFAPKVGVCYLDFNGSTWETKNISGERGIKFDALQAVDLDQDGDLDILTCEERERGRGLGLIWYENPD